VIDRGTIRVERFESAVLRGNLPGDPHVRDLHLYLPPGYDAGTRRYPVIWCLAGFTGRGRMLLNDAAWEPGIGDRMDALIASGRAQPSLLAMPDCFTHLGGSQYLNSPALGRYEDYVVDELVPLVDARFRTLADPAHRGVMGKSSGGFGAISFGMRHPEVFGGVACHSGDMAFDLCYTMDFGPAFRGLRSAGGVEPWLTKFRSARRKRADGIRVLNVLAMSASYSPNVGAPPAYCDLPFDLGTGAPDANVWKRWLAFDPVRIVDRYAGNLKRLRLLYLDCGTEDEFYLDLGARQLAERLRWLGVPHEHEEFEDGHMNIPYRYDASLPRLTAALSG
jgi:enterochelin esterase family protein